MEIFSKNYINLAKKILLDEDVLAFPTETVYGVGVLFDSKKGFDKLVELKRRPPNKPFALMCSSLEQAFEYLEIDSRTKKIMVMTLPGELTFLVKSRKDLPWHVTLGTNVIGVRVPDSKTVQDLIKEVGKPLLVTSANKSGKETTRHFEEVVKVFGDELKGIIKGECESLVPSTIINLVDSDKISLVREGSVPFSKILEVWEEIK